MGLSNFVLFFVKDTATTEIYTLSLHDALPISELEKYFYPNAATIASKAYAMVRPDAPEWIPEVEPTLPHEAAFRGPF